MDAGGGSITRRELLRTGIAWGGVAFLGPLAERVERQIASGCQSEPPGEFLGAIPLHGDRARVTPFGQIVGGRGLDARLFTDLSMLRPDRLITPSGEIFVRTEAPAAVRSTPVEWSIRLDGFRTAAPLRVDALVRRARPMGAHLIECSGNADPDNFGLMSVAEWGGVPLSEVIDGLGAVGPAAGILVSGLDHEAQASRSSAPGASWVLPPEALRSRGAFLAVTMNGARLTPDHGAPVRLVVPGWYGCSWIKWVDAIRAVSTDEPTTPQMMEFSLRTHQGGVPKLARDYVPPQIDVAATPIRVEKRRVDGRIFYRVVGIVWGGDRPVDRLAIRFTAGDTPREFAICPAPRSAQSWSLWEYRWQPTSPGVYSIALRVADSSIRTRRLDISYYVRRVIIDDI